MFYHIFKYLGEYYDIPGSGMFQYISFRAAAAIILWLLNKPGHSLHLDGIFRLNIRWDMIRRILFIGIPTGLENGMFQAGKLMVLSLITTFGTSAVAANAIANSITGVVNVPGMALGLAIITVIGRCIGAGDNDQAEHYTRLLVGASYACMVGMSVLLFFSADLLVPLFNLTPEAQAMASEVLGAYVIANALVWPMAFTLPNSLRAAGDAVFTMVVSLCSMFACRVALSYLLACSWGFGLGLLGVWLAMFADWVVRAVLFLWRYRRGKWKQIQVI